MKVLVTGGAGYIGSHTVLRLLEAGHDVVVVDNLSNSHEESLRRVSQLTGRPVEFHEVDLLDRDAIGCLFAKNEISAVIHFAGLKAVGESVQMPLRYFHNNLTGTFQLLEAMGEAGCRSLVFSSSATVYGDPASLPIQENFPLSATNPYGRTKLMLEEVLRDLYRSDDSWRIGILRYFNPIGAHPSGRIGEDPGGIPNNLVPFIAQVAVGRREALTIYGDDYPTPDGTGVRDYLHVMDLAEGHLRALEYLESNPGMLTVNLGTGRGNSVKEVVAAFERACGKPLPCVVAPRRPGDVAACYADPSKAQELLGWKASRTLDDMCRDTWRWQSSNPSGYSSALKNP
ncbi:MAG: UDP-glucose 4-epimerase GalE [Terrimicrobiaceae bacterium]